MRDDLAGSFMYTVVFVILCEGVRGERVGSEAKMYNILNKTLYALLGQAKPEPSFRSIMHSFIANVVGATEHTVHVSEYRIITLQHCSSHHNVSHAPVLTSASNLRAIALQTEPLTINHVSRNSRS